MNTPKRLIRILGAALVGLCPAGAALADNISNNVPSIYAHRLTNDGGANTVPNPFFFTMYEFYGTSLSWSTCGADATSGGCFGSGELGPYGSPCAVAGSSSRVYVADANSLVNGVARGNATIYIYAQSESAKPSVRLLKTISLNIPGSATAKCAMAVGGHFLYVGTSESSTYYQIDLQTYAMTANSACGATTSINANNDFVIVNQSGCFVGFDKYGNPWELGGELAPIFVPSTNAFIP